MVMMAAVAPALSTVDTAIILGFLVIVIFVGWVLSRAASENMEEYFLGGNKIPWWVLGISTSTSNFDMAGTMIIVAVVFALGYQALGPALFVPLFLRWYWPRFNGQGFALGTAGGAVGAVSLRASWRCHCISRSRRSRSPA